MALNPDCYLHRDVPTDLLNEIKTARKAAIDEADRDLEDLFRAGSAHPILAQAIEDEAAEIARKLGIEFTAADREWHSVPLPRHKDPTTTALCLSEDRTVELAEPYLPQLVKSGEFPVSRRYLFSTSRARLLYALAVQRVVHRKKYRFTVPTVADAVGYFAPILNLEKSCRICKISKLELEEMQRNLAAGGHYDQAPLLLPVLSERSQLETLAKRFVRFEGPHSWRVNARHVDNFIQQFPPSIRTDAINWLESLRLEDWNSFAGKAHRAIQEITKVVEADRYWVVPLSFTSGTQVCKALDALTSAAPKVCVSNDLRAAIRDSSPRDMIIFVDDNIASGVQAETAIRCLFGEALQRKEKSSYQTELEQKERAALKDRHIGFAFAWGTEKGIERVVAACKEIDLNVTRQHAAFVEPLDPPQDARKSLPSELRTYLKKIGTQLIAYDQKLDGRSKEEAYELGRQRALGYGNVEGLLVGTYGVPSSTYTALFMPGLVSLTNEQPWETEEYDFPWLPLFLRSQKADRLVFA